jgi:hypothetical protein
MLIRGAGLALVTMSAGACRSPSRAGANRAGADAQASAPAGGSAAAGSASPPSAPGELPPMASGIPVPAASVESTINPRHAPPFAGPTGTVEGVVRVSGDAAPKKALDIPFACGEAYATYGKAFREGNGRTLADVLVAITDYDGFVPPSSDVVPVTIHGCAYDTRTLALTYGQRVEVKNADPSQFFLPSLLGAELPAQIVAVPRGDPVKLYPLKVGHYVLADGMNRNWMYADVFVLRYATHAVTGLDGRFRITGIPAGKVKVSAYLPAIDSALHPDVGSEKPTAERQIEVKAGESTVADFVIPYKTPKRPLEKPTRPEGPVIR